MTTIVRTAAGNSGAEDRLNFSAKRLARKKGSMYTSSTRLWIFTEVIGQSILL